MMEFNINRKPYLRAAVAAVLCACLISCTVEPAFKVREEVSDKQLLDTVSPMVDYNVAQVLGNCTELRDELGMDITSLEGRDAVSKALLEEGGRAYVEFCYDLNAAADVESALECARPLLSDEKFGELEARADEIEREFAEKELLLEKKIAPSQRVAFIRDIRKMMVKTVVLLTAGIVYAAMPKVVLWGKVSAAAAISVAAGALAVTVCAVWEHFVSTASDSDEGFTDWLSAVLDEPKTEYAVATSVIAIGETLELGPVVAGIVLCVFAVYKGLDCLKDILKAYNIRI